MEQSAALQFPIPYVGKPDTRILEHWHQLLFLCEESNRLGETHYLIRYILGDQHPKVFGPWATEREARKKFTAAQRSAELFNAFVEVDQALENIFDVIYYTEY